MRRTIVGLLMMMTVWSAGHVFAASNHDIDSLVQKVDASYAQTQDLRAAFSQETQIEGFETRLASSGSVRLRKPGLLRWDYESPSAEHILVDGDEVLWYVPEHQQVVKGLLTHMASSKAPLALLQGVGNLREQFDVMAAPDGLTGEGGLPIVVLVPKAGDRKRSAVSRIVLEIQPTSYLIRMITLFEKSGNVSTLRFSDFEINTGLTAQALRLDLPDDVVIVDAPNM